MYSHVYTSLTNTHTHTQVIEELKHLGRADILVICGGVIPPQDYPALKEAGVAAIYGPGTNIPISAFELVGMIERSLEGSSSPSGGKVYSQN